MLIRSMIVILVAMLSACASMKKDESVLDPSGLPPTASGSGDPAVIEVWDNVGGKAVRSLTRNVRFPDQASSSVNFTDIDFPDLTGDKYGRRITGLLQVPTSGDYIFRISADDSAELWLSKDESPYNKRLLAFSNKPTGYKVWDRFKTQTSKAVGLEQGSNYFIEILHKENIGADYLAVEWAQADAEVGSPAGQFTSLSSNDMIAYTGPEAGPPTEAPVDSGSVYAIGYHAGYSSGMNLVAYDATYPLPDQDNDGLPDFYELLAGTNVNDMTDALADSDGDALTNYDEYLLLSNPSNADTDGDGIPDGYEVAYGMSLLDSGDAVLDSDQDGASNLDEYLAGTLPNDPADVPAPTGPVERLVTLSWEVPTQRQDGSSLSTNEINGYKIYSGTSANDLSNVVVVDDPGQINYSQVLPEGTYYYAISTITTDGVEGPRSSAISLTVN